MLNQYVLKNRLHVLIVLLVGSVFFITGCAGLGNKQTESFYPEYYAAKRLENIDIIKLRGFASSTDQKVSAPATLLLGINYLRAGNLSFGKLLINKSYESSHLDPQMALFGKLWKMDLLLAERDNEAAEKMKDTILATEKDDLFNRTLKIYCLNNNRALKPGDDPSVCVIEKFEIPQVVVETTPADTEVTIIDDAVDDNGTPQLDITDYGTDNMTYEEYLDVMGIGTEIEEGGLIDRNALINVVGGDVMSDMVQGMIYGIGNLNTSFRINSVTQDAPELTDDDSVAIYINKREIIANRETVSFGIDWQDLVTTASQLKRIVGTSNIVISAPNRKIQYAKYMAEILKKQEGKNIKVLNYENASFQSSLRAYLDSLPNQEVIMVGIGTEEEITGFFPVAKFLQSNKLQTVLGVVSSLSDRNLKNDYKSYFRDTYILTPIELTANKKFQSINLGYEAYFGKAMNLENVLGYDAVVYLMSLIEPAAADKYLTNIDEFIDGVALRDTGLYSINKNLQVTRIKMELVKPKVVEENETEEE